MKRNFQQAGLAEEFGAVKAKKTQPSTEELPVSSECLQNLIEIQSESDLNLVSHTSSSNSYR